MKLKLLFITPLVVLGLNSCVVVDESGMSSTAPRSSQSFGQPLTFQTGTGSVTIREGSRVLTTIRTARPNVEQARWYSEQEQIAVKSRGNHGPATIQLFDSRTGRQLGSVMAYEAANGPAWASPLAE